MINGPITEVNYEIHSGKIDRPVKIAALADLHSHIYGKNQEDLIDPVKRQKPDLIFLIGDMVDDKRKDLGARLLLEAIRGLAPVYYVTGNHEFRSREANEIKELVRSYGVTVLEDTCCRTVIRGVPVCIAGIDDSDKTQQEDAGYCQEQAMDRAFGNLERNPDFKILLAHRPEWIKTYYQKYGFDLVLSGHAHGGQVRIPHVVNGLYAPGQGLFPPYAGGLYQHGELLHIVSRGLAFNWLRPRICNPPELVIIRLEP